MTRGRPEEKDGSRRRLGKLAAAFVIGRRDYCATVLSRSFLLFLLGPLFPVLLGVLFGGIGAGIASDAERSAVTVIAAPADFARLTAARGELAVLPAAGRLPDLVRAEPGSDPARLLGSARPSRAILADPLFRVEHLTHSRGHFRIPIEFGAIGGHTAHPCWVFPGKPERHITAH